MDGCSPAHNITRWVAALDALPGPRELLLENCGDNHDRWSAPDVSTVSGFCGFQMYRISSDIAPQFYSTMYNLQAMIPYADVSRPGCWSYPGAFVMMLRNSVVFLWAIFSLCPFVLVLTITSCLRIGGRHAASRLFKTVR